MLSLNSSARLPLRSSLTSLFFSTTSSSSSSPPPAPLDPDAVLDTLSSYANDWQRAFEFFRWATSSSSSPLPPPSSPASSTSSASTSSSRSPSPSSPPPLPRPLSLLPAFRSLFNRLAAARLLPDALSALRLASSLRLPPGPSPSSSSTPSATAASSPTPNPSSSAPLPPPSPRHQGLQPPPPRLAQGPPMAPLPRALARHGPQPRPQRPPLLLRLHGRPLQVRQALERRPTLQGDGAQVRPRRRRLQHRHPRPRPLPGRRLLHQALPGDARRRVPPNAATYNTILKLLCKEGRFREAYSFVSRMKKHGCEPNALTYHCFFQYLNRPQEVLALFERMLERGCRPRTDTYVMLIKRFGRWGFLRPVFVVWKKMEEHGCSPDAFAYNALIDALLQRGMVEMARKYDEEMLAKGLSPKPRKELGSKRSDEDNVLSGVF
uniref:Pentatricopeptide repeat-containing protein n=1 Tax=Ananas comosus var. bracteatus TaxID=296719 RepID=A0A6V7P4C9_ANACO|nr:unnamed protein product [Ananas comosus var. bracteatus]